MEHSCFTSFVDIDSTFYIKILERGFIKNVYLLICPSFNDAIEKHSFDSIIIEKADFFDRRLIHDDLYYSEFICPICFSEPISSMEYCFFYQSNDKDYKTYPQKFEIQNY